MKKLLQIIFLANIFILFSCNTIVKVEIPEDIIAFLDTIGDNRVELEKVINHYHEDSLKLNAAFFLIENMGDHCYSKYKLVDSTDSIVPFNILDYPDYNSMVAAYDSIEGTLGELEFKRDTLIKDYQLITADFMIQNIDYAFKAWRENPWSKHLSFQQFCEFVLPYRGSNEPLENWRPYFIDKYNWIPDSMKNSDDPIKAATMINNELKSWFSFDPRFYRHPTDLGLSQMLEYKMGRCEDMTNLAIYAMRAMGIPVMSDYTPYWAKTNNNHAWNATIDKEGKVIVFMGSESNPGVYKLNNVISKVYRKTFSIQHDCLAEIKEDWEKVPPYINRNSYTDFTKDYIPVIDISLWLEKEVPDSVNFAYICVFNTAKWKAIHWSKITDDREVIFTDMGMDIVYLPAFYIDKKIVLAGKPFILNEKGQIHTIIPDTINKSTVELYSTTKRVITKATEESEQVHFDIGKTYELFYWNDEWILHGKQKAGDGPLIFKNVPSNALYWLVAEDSHDEERIFTINQDAKQVWW